VRVPETNRDLVSALDRLIQEFVRFAG